MPNMSSLSKFTPFFIMLVVLVLSFQYLGPVGGLLALFACIVWLVWRRRASVFYSSARKCFDTGDMDSARVNIKRAVTAEPENSILRASCGFMYLKMGSPVDAERMLNVALSTAKTPTEKYNAQTITSLLLWKKGKLDEAIELLETVMENYKTTTTYSTMGFFMVARGDVKKAVDFNREAYEFNAKNPVILDNFGSALIMAGEYEEAQKIYEALIPLKPTFPDAYFNCGRLLETLGRYQDALNMYQTAASRKFWFTSTITREEVDEHLETLEEKMGLPAGGRPLVTDAADPMGVAEPVETAESTEPEESSESAESTEPVESEDVDTTETITKEEKA